VLSMALRPSPVSPAPTMVIATERSIRLYDLSTGTPNFSMHLEQPHATNAVKHFHRTPFVFSGGTDGRIRLWNVQSPQYSMTMSAGIDNVQLYSASPDAIKEVSPASGRGLPSHHNDSITALEVVPLRSSAHLVSAARDGSLTVWHNHIPSSGNPSCTLQRELFAALV
jgi:WD40 repeat protein